MEPKKDFPINEEHKILKDQDYNIDTSHISDSFYKCTNTCTKHLKCNSYSKESDFYCWSCEESDSCKFNSDCWRSSKDTLKCTHLASCEEKGEHIIPGMNINIINQNVTQILENCDVVAVKNVKGFTKSANENTKTISSSLEGKVSSETDSSMKKVVNANLFKSFEVEAANQTISLKKVGRINNKYVSVPEIITTSIALEETEDLQNVNFANANNVIRNCISSENRVAAECVISETGVTIGNMTSVIPIVTSENLLSKNLCAIDSFNASVMALREEWVAVIKNNIAERRESIARRRKDIVNGRILLARHKKVVAPLRTTFPMSAENRFTHKKLIDIQKIIIAGHEDTVKKMEIFLSIQARRKINYAYKEIIATPTSVITTQMLSNNMRYATHLKTIAACKKVISLCRRTIVVCRENIVACSNGISLASNLFSYDETVTSKIDEYMYMKCKHEFRNYIKECIASLMEHIILAKDVIASCKENITVLKKRITEHKRAFTYKRAIAKHSLITAVPWITFAAYRTTNAVCQCAIAVFRDFFFLINISTSNIIANINIAKHRGKISTDFQKATVSHKETTIYRKATSISKKATSISKKSTSVSKKSTRVSQKATPKELDATLSKEASLATKAIPATKEVSPATQEVSSTTKEVSPATKETISLTKEVSPATKETIPATKEVSPATKETIPATKEVSPVTKETILATKEVSPATKEAILVAKENFQISKEAPSLEAESRNVLAADEVATAVSKGDISMSTEFNNIKLQEELKELQLFEENIFEAFYREIECDTKDLLHMMKRVFVALDLVLCLANKGLKGRLSISEVIKVVLKMWGIFVTVCEKNVFEKMKETVDCSSHHKYKKFCSSEPEKNLLRILKLSSSISSLRFKNFSEVSNLSEILLSCDNAYEIDFHSTKIPKVYLEENLASVVFMDMRQNLTTVCLLQQKVFSVAELILCVINENLIEKCFIRRKIEPVFEVWNSVQTEITKIGDSIEHLKNNAYSLSPVVGLNLDLPQVGALMHKVSKWRSYLYGKKASYYYKFSNRRFWWSCITNFILRHKLKDLSEFKLDRLIQDFENKEHYKKMKALKALNDYYLEQSNLANKQGIQYNFDYKAFRDAFFEHS